MRYIALALLALCASPARAGESNKGISPDAVWKDAERVMPEIVKACDAAPDFPACFAERIAGKAPAPVVAFLRATHNEAWMRDFRKTGRVDVAYVVNQFRANQNAGWLFVNGSPALFDPDDFKRIEGALKNDPEWARVTARYPKAMLFAGDRSSLVGPIAVEYPDGAQEFIADYRVMDGCHACEVIGNAFLSFDFNPKGKFTALHFLGFEKELIWLLRTHSGQRFTLGLGCDAGQSCDWIEEQPPAESVLRATGKLSYEVTGAGATQTTLRHGGATLELKVIAAPGLRR